MRYRDSEGRYVGVRTEFWQRKCDRCGRDWQSGYIRFERNKSVESICHRCASNP